MVRFEQRYTFFPISILGQECIGQVLDKRGSQNIQQFLKSVCLFFFYFKHLSWQVIFYVVIQSDDTDRNITERLDELTEDVSCGGKVTHSQQRRGGNLTTSAAGKIPRDVSTFFVNLIRSAKTRGKKPTDFQRDYRDVFALYLSICHVRLLIYTLRLLLVIKQHLIIIKFVIEFVTVLNYSNISLLIQCSYYISLNSFIL